jgi:phosphatidylserine/phosphatidylglycerophosphate/cardiolipin synthase-like enzyme
MRVRLIALIFAVTATLQASPKASDIHTYFSPNGGCTEAIVKAVGEAKKSVFVQAYYFTSEDIADALVKAKNRGVDVEVILDHSQKTEMPAMASYLSNAGIPTCIDSAHKIAHNKVMVIDGNEVLTGSFNFTNSAEESNAENLLVITHARKLAKAYTDNWKEHLAHSEKYVDTEQSQNHH